MHFNFRLWPSKCPVTDGVLQYAPQDKVSAPHQGRLHTAVSFVSLEQSTRHLDVLTPGYRLSVWQRYWLLQSGRIACQAMRRPASQLSFVLLHKRHSCGSSEQLQELCDKQCDMCKVQSTPRTARTSSLQLAKVAIESHRQSGLVKRQREGQMTGHDVTHDGLGNRYVNEMLDNGPAAASAPACSDNPQLTRSPASQSTDASSKLGCATSQ